MAGKQKKADAQEACDLYAGEDCEEVDIDFDPDEQDNAFQLSDAATAVMYEIEMDDGSIQPFVHNFKKGTCLYVMNGAILITHPKIHPSELGIVEE